MPRLESSVMVPVAIDLAFAVAQATAQFSYPVGPFDVEQHLLDGALVPAKGVRAATSTGDRLRMVSQYTSFRAPTKAGMKMLDGPRFVAELAGGWGFEEVPGGTLATWRYRYSFRPKPLAPFLDRAGTWLLRKEMEQRLTNYAASCEDPTVIAAAQASA